MKNIGVKVTPPKTECEDIYCPFHGSLSTRGRILDGAVTSSKARGLVIVRRDYTQFNPKYMRSERRHSSIPAHSPPCIDAKTGDKVKIIECKPLSKTVHFVVIEKMEEK
ncbi:MAG TPA: 30S ribosomal protein S17 [archaeon]|nr:30S ribosomal protein S17 [archaeon]